MQKTMKAAVVREFGKPLVIEEVPVPKVLPGQILVKIAASGVCHTDLHAAEGDWPVKPKPPFIPGHEGVGHVVAVGAGVRRVKEGIGTVDAVEGDRIKLTKKDSGEGSHRGHHHFIPLSLVAEVEGDTIRLSANADVAVTFEEEEKQ